MGESGALRELYDATVDRAYRAALRVLKDPSLAEDAVAATFVQVWKSAGRFDPERSSPLGWVALIARSRALDLARGLASGQQGDRSGDRLGERLSGHDNFDEPGPSVDARGENSDASQVAQSRESSERVRCAVERLPEAQRTAIECAFFDGLTHIETAQRLGAPLGTVKYRIRAALDELRVQLGPLGVEWGFVDSNAQVRPS